MRKKLKNCINITNKKIDDKSSNMIGTEKENQS